MKWLTDSKGHTPANLHNLIEGFRRHDPGLGRAGVAQNLENHRAGDLPAPRRLMWFRTPRGPSNCFPGAFRDNDASCVTMAMEKRRLKFHGAVVGQAICLAAAQNTCAAHLRLPQGRAPPEHGLDDDLMYAFPPHDLRLSGWEPQPEVPFRTW